MCRWHHCLSTFLSRETVRIWYPGSNPDPQRQLPFLKVNVHRCSTFNYVFIFANLIWTLDVQLGFVFANCRLPFLSYPNATTVQGSFCFSNGSSSFFWKPKTTDFGGSQGFEAIKIKIIPPSQVKPKERKHKKMKEKKIEEKKFLAAVIFLRKRSAVVDIRYQREETVTIFVLDF